MATTTRTLAPAGIGASAGAEREPIVAPDGGGSAQQLSNLGERERWIALVVLCAGFLMIVLDQTIVNVALPSIRTELRFSQASLAWVVNAYLIAFGGLLLLVGRLGDLIGRRRIFLIGLSVFTSASLVCGLAQSPVLLVVARFVQGIGGAMTSAVILGMIVAMFPAPSDQARAIGVYSLVASAGGAVGLLAGGVLTQGLSWHWIFFLNLPIGAVTAVSARRLLPDDTGAGGERGADIPGGVLLVGSVMLAVYTIVEAGRYSWGSVRTLGLGVVALALLGGFALRQARATSPLISLRVFRSRTVTGANLIQALMVAGMFGVFFLGALYMQRVLHYDAIQVGAAFLPVALGIAAMSLALSARLINRFGGRATLLPGLVLIAAGLALFSRVPVHARYMTDLLPAMVPLGIGGGLAFPSLLTLAMSTATPEDSGLVSGLVNTIQQVGGALGLAVLATLSANRTSSALADGRSLADSLTSGYHLAFVIAAGLVVAAIVLTAVLLRPDVRSVAGGSTVSEPVRGARAQTPIRSAGCGCHGEQVHWILDDCSPAPSARLGASDQHSPTPAPAVLTPAS
jgi:EmrB/QacA subfamily drug resistance transporter